MSFPTLVAPTYNIKLLSWPKPISFRPYLVKEEKLLFIAQQGEDRDEVERAIKQIIRNCTFDTVDPERLAVFDVALMFLQLRAKSVNNVIQSKFRCTRAVASPDPTKTIECGTIVEVAINIDDIKLTVPEGHTNKIMLTDTLGITLNYPTLDVALKSDDIATVLPACLDTVFSSNGEVFEAKEQTPQEIASFVESLTLPQVDKVRTFFETMPHLEHKFTFVCPKCHWTEEAVLRDLMDFFD